MNAEEIKKSDILKQLDLKKNEYFIVSAHREENVGTTENFLNLVESLNEIASSYEYPVVLSTHPRTRKIINENNIKFHNNVRLLKPLSFIDYNNLQINSKVVLSDSGTISEETSILGLKSLNIREAHERPEAMEEATVMMVGLKKDNILRALKVLDNTSSHLVSDYGKDNVSEKVLKIILSYTEYINNKVWKL